MTVESRLPPTSSRAVAHVATTALDFTPMDLAVLEAEERRIGWPVESPPRPPDAPVRVVVRRSRGRSSRPRRSARTKPAASDSDPEPDAAPFPANRSSPATDEGEEPAPRGASAATGDARPQASSRHFPSPHTLTQELAERLQRIGESMAPTPRRARVLKQARRMRDCAGRDAEGKRTANRCKLPACPSCQRQQAIRHNQKLSELLAEAEPDRLRFVRLSVVPPDDTVEAGLRVLFAALSKLRRRVVWTRSIAAGVQHVETAAARDDSARRWNVHAHLVLLLRGGADLDAGELSAAWSRALADEWAEGSVHVVDRVDLGGGR